MTHCELLQEQIVALLKRASGEDGPWHVECDLVAIFERQGFEADYIRDTIDDLIDDGQLEFMRNSFAGDDFVGLSELTAGLPAATLPVPTRAAPAGASSV